MKIGILGAGAMGSGIAQVFAMNGNYSIYLCDLTVTISFFAIIRNFLSYFAQKH